VLDIVAAEQQQGPEAAGRRVIFLKAFRAPSRASRRSRRGGRNSRRPCRSRACTSAAAQNPWRRGARSRSQSDRDCPPSRAS
jgi:hypothetical protein